MTIQLAQTPEDIAKCTRAMLELRPHIAAETFVPLVQDMMKEGYQLAFIEENDEAAAVIGFRYLQFLYCGKHFYIDDLSTLPEARGKGYGGMLLDYVADLARAEGYEVITLDSGHHRHTAHRLYLNKGFFISSHHFSKKLG
ncbi:MAG: GNAT family N-acetyltransferase [Saprospiraceae bacterium]|nr:GNAT family N-acetyltransferase [Saprospiraceae bacterium]